MRTLIGNPDAVCLVSAATAWEITTKVRIGKLPGVEAVALDVVGAIASQGFEQLPILLVQAQLAGSLPGPHRDPFDRMLAAQAQIEAIPIVSVDGVFDTFGVRRIG